MLFYTFILGKKTSNNLKMTLGQYISMLNFKRNYIKGFFFNYQIKWDEKRVFLCLKLKERKQNQKESV